MSQQYDKPTHQQPQRPVKSQFQLILDHLRRSRAELVAAGTAASNFVFELQKAEDFIQRFEHGLTIAIEEGGGTVNVEDEIKQFLPKIFRRPEQVSGEQQ